MIEISGFAPPVLNNGPDAVTLFTDPPPPPPPDSGLNERYVLAINYIPLTFATLVTKLPVPDAKVYTTRTHK